MGEPIEETRRGQLIEVTIDSLAELGYVGTTLAQIASRAGGSPGLVAHYFGDKDGLLDAAFRSLARRVSDHARSRLRQLSTPRARIQAVIDANLAPEEFDQRTGTAWLAFWGQVLQVKSLRRVQSVYQRRTLTTLRSALNKLVPPDQAQSLAAMIASMIDGVWLRAALSGWREADSASARALLTEFVDRRLQGLAPALLFGDELAGKQGFHMADPFPRQALGLGGVQGAHPGAEQRTLLGRDLPGQGRALQSVGGGEGRCGSGEAEGEAESSLQAGSVVEFVAGSAA